MRAEIKLTKALLNPGITMFGVDLLLPSTDEGARKTNKGVGNDLLTQLVRIPPDLQHAPRVSVGIRSDGSSGKERTASP